MIFIFQKLSQDAHVNSEIFCGLYRGLSCQESAVEVTTTIHELFNFQKEWRQRGVLGDIESNLPHIFEELKRREWDTPGVMDEEAISLMNNQ